MAFLNDPINSRKVLGAIDKNGRDRKPKNDSQSKYTRRLVEFAKITKRVLTNSYEVFQNFHSRLLENMSEQIDESDNTSKSSNKSKYLSKYNPKRQNKT